MVRDVDDAARGDAVAARVRRARRCAGPCGESGRADAAARDRNDIAASSVIRRGKPSMRSRASGVGAWGSRYLGDILALEDGSSDVVRTHVGQTIAEPKRRAGLPCEAYVAQVSRVLFCSCSSGSLLVAGQTARPRRFRAIVRSERQAPGRHYRTRDSFRPDRSGRHRHDRCRRCVPLPVPQGVYRLEFSGTGFATAIRTGDRRCSRAPRPK